MRHGDTGKILDVDFKERKLNYSYTHNYVKEEQMKKDLCLSLAKACDLVKELYSDDKQWLEWFARQIKTISFKIKEN